MKIIFTSVLLIALFICSCDSSVEPVVGQKEYTSIQNLLFDIDTTFIDAANKILVASGTVKNNGSSEVSSPWYIEAQFYTDASRSLKIGGNETQIGVPLSKGQGTFWKITYTSSKVDVTSFPKFSVGDIRGIYK